MVGFSDRRLRRGLLLSDVSGLSEARFREKVQLSRALRRAFDKAVRRKPPVIAADAGPMQIQWGKVRLSRCAGGVRRSAEDNTARRGVGRSAKLSLTQSGEKPSVVSDPSPCAHPTLLQSV